MAPIEDLHRVATDAKKLCQDSSELIRQSRQLSAESQALKQWWRGHRKNQGPSRPYVAVAKSDRPFVASARRIPWRRLQFEDMEGVIEWNSPDYVPF